jgi:RNA polymerase sigma-70 factor (ECF subfamily)
MFDLMTHKNNAARPALPAYAGDALSILLRQKGQPVPDQTVLHQPVPTPDDWGAMILRVSATHDKEAFAALFRHFAPRIKGFLMKSGASAGLAEECAQDVMTTLWHKAHLFDPTRASAATWVFTIARNRRIDALRKSRRPEPEELPWGPEPEPDQHDVLEMSQETARLAEALADLPDAQRDLIARAYFGELSHSEIAAETGLPLGTIKSRIRLALDRLRHKLS